MPDADTNHGERKVVWILGAGFSRPLGGPLMDDLFRERQGSELELLKSRIRADEHDIQQLCLAVGVYRLGAQRRLWGDAESYLTSIDHAARDVGTWRPRVLACLNDLPGQPGLNGINPHLSEHDTQDERISTLQSSAKLALALDCAEFLIGVGDSNVESDEMWMPYTSWANGLHQSDTVISFNYDGVLDLLAASRFGDLRVVAPSHDLRKGRIPRHGDGLALKLHGSLFWRARSDGIVSEPSLAFSMCDVSSLVLGTPGVSKGDTKSSLDALWVEAELSAREASDIVFIGYRFPQSDAYSRKAVLDWIRANDDLNCRVHVVLGPDVSHPDIQRMSSLLTMAAGVPRALVRGKDLIPTKGRQVILHSLWGEDFLSHAANHLSFDSSAH